MIINKTKLETKYSELCLSVSPRQRSCLPSSTPLTAGSKLMSSLASSSSKPPTSLSASSTNLKYLKYCKFYRGNQLFRKILIIIIALNVDLRQPFSRPGVLSRLWCQIWWGAANPADDTFPFCSSTALPKSLPPLPTLFQRRPSVTGDKQPALGCRSGRQPHLVKTQDLPGSTGYI